MHCLKCGTEIEAPQVFCDRCLVDMKNHPVSRETPVNYKIMFHVKHPPAKEAHMEQKVEELLAVMRKRQRRLVQICVVLSCICLVLLALLLFLPSYGSANPTIGQNYVTNVTQPSR